MADEQKKVTKSNSKYKNTNILSAYSRLYKIGSKLIKHKNELIQKEYDKKKRDRKIQILWKSFEF